VIAKGVYEMSFAQTEPESLHIGRNQLLAFVSSMIGINSGRDDDDHPLPPGPWDPVIRVALQQIYSFSPHPDPWRAVNSSSGARRTIGTLFGPSPEPWKVLLAGILAKHPEIYDAIGGGHSFGEDVALNPQPLPPRYAFLVAAARALVSRAELLQEIADSTLREGTQQGIIIVGGFTARFTDDWCGNGFRLRWPFPGPRPNWFTQELSGIDLLVMAAQFHETAKETFNPSLRQNLADAGARFVEAGMSKMQ
jgi:hypothetical protein